MIDFGPCIALLAITGLWQLWGHFGNVRLSRSLIALGGSVLMTASVLSTSLLAMSNKVSAFKYQLNPEFWRHLLSLFFHP